MNTEFSKTRGGDLTIGGTTKAADLLTLGAGSSTIFTGALTASGGLTVAEGAFGRTRFHTAVAILSVA